MPLRKKLPSENINLRVPATMQAMHRLACLVFLVSCLSPCLGTKFVMFPMQGRSHFLVLARVANELLERDHEVVIFAGDCESYAVKEPYVKTFKCSEFLANSNLVDAIHLVRVMRDYCDATLSDEGVMKETSTADFVIGDSMYLCSFLIAAKFSLPHGMILVSSLGSATATFAMNLPEMPSYLPQFQSKLTDHMTLSLRVMNTMRWLFNKFVSSLIVRYVYQPLKDKYRIAPAKSLQEVFNTVDIIISQSTFILDYPRPLMPNTKLVGPILASPAKPLPVTLEEFFGSSGDYGVILVSFGTILGDPDDKIIAVMEKGFSKLPQKVIWKLKKGKKSFEFGENTNTLPFLPQNDILGHPKTRLFIGHGGLSSILEAGYHGIPMICVPFFGDQFDNAAAAKHFGMAEVLYPESMTKESLVNTINTVLNNASYRDSAARISKMMRLRRRTSVQEAADWIEYAQAQGGLRFLRPRSLDLPFYQLYLLDVLTLELLTMIGVFFLVKSLFKCCFRYCCKSQTVKEKSE